MNPYFPVRVIQEDIDSYPYLSETYIMEIKSSSKTAEDADSHFPTNRNRIYKDTQSDNNEGVISKLFYLAMNKYGPSFTKLVNTVIPCVDVMKDHINMEDYVSRVLKEIDLELGYTKNELYMMNEPILEYGGHRYTKVHERISEEDRINENDEEERSSSLQGEGEEQHVKIMVDSFYRELREDYYLSTPP